MKILIATYSAETHSSFGKVARELWRRLRALHPDWDVMQHGWMHRSDEKVNWLIEGTKVAQTTDGPRMVAEDRYGSMSFEGIVSRFRPDVVWALGDPFMCDYMGQYRARYKFRLIKHLTFDGAPMPSIWVDGVRDTDLVVPITHFGARVCEPVLGHLPKHIYHGVDTDLFSPGPRVRPQEGKVTNDTFVLGYVGHHQWRKQNWNMFALTRYMRDGGWVLCQDCDRVTLSEFDEIWSRLGPLPTQCFWCRGTRVTCFGPQDIAFWCHTYDRQDRDFQPEKLKAVWGIEGSVLFTNGMTADHGISERSMSEIYRLFDAYLCLSGGEGFGMTIPECYAAGVPVIYTNYSGHGEIGAYAGFPVRACAMQPNPKEPVNRAIADLSDAVRQVWRVKTDKPLVREHVLRGQVAAKDVFDWNLIANEWGRVLEENVVVRRRPTIGVTL